MRKRVMLTLMLLVALLVTSSCGLIVKDAEVDKQTTIIEVLGKVYTKAEVTEQVNSVLDYQEYLYSLYGFPFDKTDSTSIAQARTEAIAGLIRQAATEQKAIDLGADALTEEELAALQASAEESYNSYVEMVKSSYFADTELTGEELEQAVAEQMTALNIPALQEFVDSETSTKVQENLRAEVVKDVAVTDAEIQTKYDENVAAAKINYEATLSAYSTDVRNGSTVYYTPAGYRYVKHILLELSDEDTTLIQEWEGKASAAQTRVTDADTSLASLNEDPEQDTEEEAANRALWAQNKTEAEAELTAANAELDTVWEAAYDRLQPSVDEILQKIAEAADFDALIEEYGADPGMSISPAKEDGYLVCAGDTQWVTEFTEAAMALENIGDISPAVRSDYGIHILKYISDLAEGDVPLEQVTDIISEELLSAKQEEFYEAAVSQWITDANAKSYVDRLN